MDRRINHHAPLSVVPIAVLCVLLAVSHVQSQPAPVLPNKGIEYSLCTNIAEVRMNPDECSLRVLMDLCSNRDVFGVCAANGFCRRRDSQHPLSECQQCGAAAGPGQGPEPPASTGQLCNLLSAPSEVAASGFVFEGWEAIPSRPAFAAQAIPTTNVVTTIVQLQQESLELIRVNDATFPYVFPSFATSVLHSGYPWSLSATAALNGQAFRWIGIAARPLRRYALDPFGASAIDGENPGDELVFSGMSAISRVARVDRRTFVSHNMTAHAQPARAVTVGLTRSVLALDVDAARCALLARHVRAMATATLTAAKVAVDPGNVPVEAVNAAQHDASRSPEFLMAGATRFTHATATAGSKLLHRVSLPLPHAILAAGKNTAMHHHGFYSDAQVSGIFAPISPWLSQDEADRAVAASITLQQAAAAGTEMAITNANRIFPVLVRPVRFTFVQNFSKVIWYSDGSYSVHPIPLSRTHFPATADPSSDPIAEPTKFVRFRDFMFSTGSGKKRIAQFQRAGEAKERELVIVYEPGTRLVQFFGRNTDGQFGLNQDDVGVDHAGDIRTLAALSDPIRKVAVGHAHVVILTQSGAVFYAGSVASSNAACGGSDRVFWDRMPMTPSGVADIGAGFEFSVLVTRASSSDGGQLCGGAGFMSPDNEGANTDLRGMLAQGGALSVFSVKTGAFHFCVGFRFQSITDETYGMDAACFGASGINGAGDVSIVDPVGNAKICSGRQTGGYANPYRVARVDDFDSGRHHVMFMQKERNDLAGSQQANVNADLFPDFRKVFVCGENNHGQLGNNPKIRQDAPFNIYPIFGVSERVLSARSPNVLVRDNDDPRLGTLSRTTVNRDFYQIFEVTEVAASDDNSFVFAAMKPFNNPTLMMSNFSHLLRQRPPDGPYALPQVFADIIRPYGSKFDLRPTDAESAKLVWNMSFSLVPGLALFHVGTQAPVEVAAMPLGPPPYNVDPTGWNTTEPFADVCSGGSCFRDWAILRKNQSSMSTFAIDNLGMLTVTDIVWTLSFPSVFFITTDARTYALDRLSTACSPDPHRTPLLCAEDEKVVVWRHPASSATPPDGYTFAASDGVSVAMHVSVHSVNVTKRYPHFGGAVVIPTTPDNFTLAERELLLRSTPGLLRPETWNCWPIHSTHDCSSVVFYEPFNPSEPSLAVRYAHASGAVLWEWGTNFTNTTSSIIVRPRPPFQTASDLVTTTHMSSTVCIFLKLGRFEYFLKLHEDGEAEICEGGELSRRTLTVTPTLDLGGGGTPEQGLERDLFGRWELLAPNQLSLYNLDRRNNLAWLDPSRIANLTFDLGPMGGVARDDSHTYMLFTNHTVRLLRRMNSLGDRAVSVDATEFGVKPTGVGDVGGLLIPVHPVVEELDIFEVFLRPRAATPAFMAPRPEDEFTIELVAHAGEAPDAVLASDPDHTPARIVVRISGAYAEVDRLELDPRRWPNTAPTFVSSGETRADGERAVISAVEADPDSFFCVKRPLSFSEWTRLLVAHEAEGNATRIFLDDNLVCAGRLLDRRRHLARVSAINFNIRNPSEAPTLAMEVREVVMCQQRIRRGTTVVPSLMPCAGAGRRHGDVLFSSSSSVSRSSSFSVSVSVSQSQSESLNATASVSQSVSESTTQSISSTSSSTATVSRSQTESSSQTHTVSESLSATYSGATITPTLNVTLRLGRFDHQALTVHNVRRGGFIIPLILQDASFAAGFDSAGGLQFAPRILNKAEVLLINASRSAKENPNGIIVNFYRQGFVTATFASGDQSRLYLQLGPSQLYNSFHDEVVTLRLHPLALATQQNLQQTVSFTIIGRGFVIGDNLRAIEAASASVVAATVLLGAAPSNIIRVSTHSMLMNFRCFNNEHMVLPYLWSPTRLRVDGSDKLGAIIMAPLIMGLILGIHALAVVFVRLKKCCSWIKACGDVYFPSFSLLFASAFAPNLLTTSFQFALERLNIFVVAGVVALFCVTIGLPVLYLLSVLYDGANFAAEFKYDSPEYLQNRCKKNPVLSRFLLPGVWVSTDRHNAFVRRLWFCLGEFSRRRPYWMVIEFMEAALFGLASFATNDVPLVCMAQLAFCMCIHAGVFAAIIKWHPHHTTVGNVSALGFSGIQSLIITIRVVDIFQGETRFVESSTRFMFTSSWMVLVFVSIVQCVAALRFRVERWQHQKHAEEWARVAQHAAPLLDPEDGLELRVLDLSSMRRDRGNLTIPDGRGDVISTDASTAVLQTPAFLIDSHGNMVPADGQLTTSGGAQAMNLRSLLRRMGVAPDEGSREDFDKPELEAAARIASQRGAKAAATEESPTVTANSSAAAPRQPAIRPDTEAEAGLGKGSLREEAGEEGDDAAEFFGQMENKIVPALQCTLDIPAALSDTGSHSAQELQQLPAATDVERLSADESLVAVSSRPANECGDDDVADPFALDPFDDDDDDDAAAAAASQHTSHLDLHALVDASKRLSTQIVGGGGAGVSAIKANPVERRRRDFWRLLAAEQIAGAPPVVAEPPFMEEL